MCFIDCAVFFVKFMLNIIFLNADYVEFCIFAPVGRSVFAPPQTNFIYLFLKIYIMSISFHFLFGEFVVNVENSETFKKLENLKSIQDDLLHLLPQRSMEIDNFIMSSVREIISDVHK